MSHRHKWHHLNPTPYRKKGDAWHSVCLKCGVKRCRLAMYVDYVTVEGKSSIRVAPPCVDNQAAK